MTDHWQTAAAAILVCISAVPATAEPRLQDVLGSVTLSFAADGGRDRAVLVQNNEEAADIYIYRAVDLPETGKPLLKPAFFKKSVVFAGTAWGQAPSLSVNQKGSLVIHSENTGIGRNKWEQSLTVIVRNGKYVVAGITYSSHDGLDPNAGGSCDVNLLTGKALRNGKAVADKVPQINLIDWADEKLPKSCQF